MGCFLAIFNLTLLIKLCHSIADKCSYFEGETEAIDVLDAEKHDILLKTKEPNKDDLFVVSSQPKTSMDILSIC